MSSAQFNNSSVYTKLASSGHGDQLFCKCLWCSGYALWMYGHWHIWRKNIFDRMTGQKADGSVFIFLFLFFRYEVERLPEAS